jgi:hypothetical protein
VEGDYVACQAAISGSFVRNFTHLAVGPLPPNGQRVTFEPITIVRYDAPGRLVAEWI